MSANMTNSCDATTFNDDDPTSTSCLDDGDTSFEIDEPDEEEVEPEFGRSDGLSENKLIVLDICNALAEAAAHEDDDDDDDDEDDDDDDDDAATASPTLRSSASPSLLQACVDELRSYAVPLVAIGDDTRSDSSPTLSHTGSSTPTTADVADVTTTAVMALSDRPAARAVERLSPLRQHHHHQHHHHQHARIAAATPTPTDGRHSATANGYSGGSYSGYADDNLSGSIATTTTELIDYDGIVSDGTGQAGNAGRLRSGTEPSDSPSSTSAAQPIPVHRPPDSRHMRPQPGKNHDQLDHRRTMSASSYRSTSSQHPTPSSLPPVMALQSGLMGGGWIDKMCGHFKSSGIGEPSVYHALVVIFLEFFAWGLLTMPVISVLNQTFPDHTFLMNGLVMGIKGILSFLSAPLIGALSDIWGRKFFLLITVFFTCAPIPLMTINTWWFFAMISISGVFAVTFSVVFAYVADVTTVEERSRAYGLVSATFAASLVISPALGAFLMETYSDTLVVALATAIAVLDVFFILVAVPESLPEKVRPSSWGAPISWEQADPFAALRKVGSDHTILMQCVTVLLSYLPEAGQYSCIFVYLKLKMGFNSMEVAIFIAVVGILSISVQVTLGYLMRVLGGKRTIILGLILEMMQLLWYGFGSQAWMMWAAGVLAALGSITYPAISAFVSIHSNADRQGAVQGMVTGMRGLCNGLGPAMFGVIFYLFNVDLNDDSGHIPSHDGAAIGNRTLPSEKLTQLVPGPPFVFGAFMVILAILVAIFIPEVHGEIGVSRAPSEKKRVSLDVQYEIECGHKATGPLAPLMRSDSMAQL